MGKISGVCCVANLGFVKFSYRFLETIFFYLFNILTSQKKWFPFFGLQYYFCPLATILDGTYDKSKIARIINDTSFKGFSGS